MSSLVLCLLKSFALWAVFLLLNLWSSLYLLGPSPLSDMCFANIFFYSVAWLFFFKCPSKSSSFKYRWSLFYQFFKFMVHAFVFYLRNLGLTQGHNDFLCCFLPEACRKWGIYKNAKMYKNTHYEPGGCDRGTCQSHVPRGMGRFTLHPWENGSEEAGDFLELLYFVVNNAHPCFCVYHTQDYCIHYSTCGM